MSTTTIHPCTLGVDGLAQLGRTRNDLRGLRFANDPAPSPAPADPAPADPAPTPAPAPAPSDPAPTDPAPAGGKVEDLPSWAQKLLGDTRAEAAKYRTGAQTAAQKAEQALADKIAVALGQKPDASTDPAALTAALTETQAAKRQADLQLAVYRAAGANGANPDALLDSNTFLASVKDLDPSAADFGTQVGGAIKAAVAANSTLKQARAASASTTDNPGGEPGLITEQQLTTMSPEQIDKAFREGKLKHLLA